MDFDEDLCNGDQAAAVQPLPKPLVIQVSSSGFDGDCFAKITINDIPVDIGKNENNYYRGLHIAVIDPGTGKPKVAKSFDTYDSSASLEEFIASEKIPNGFIVAAACRDDCVK